MIMLIQNSDFSAKKNEQNLDRSYFDTLVSVLLFKLCIGYQ